MNLLLLVALVVLGWWVRKRLLDDLTTLRRRVGYVEGELLRADRARTKAEYQVIGLRARLAQVEAEQDVARGQHLDLAGTLAQLAAPRPITLPDTLIALAKKRGIPERELHGLAEKAVQALTGG